MSALKETYQVTINFKDGSEAKVIKSFYPAPSQMLNMWVFEETNGNRHVYTIDKISDIEIKGIGQS